MATKFKKPEKITEPVLVGREQNMQDLQDYFNQQRKGIPRFLLLHGKQGFGKTRIIKELIPKLQEREIEIFQETCLEEDSQNLFNRIVHLVHQIYTKRGILSKKHYVGSPPAMLAQDFIEFAITSYDEAIGNIFADVESDLTKIYNSVASYIRSHSHAQPICIIIEDLHFVDRQTGEFLLYLMNEMAQSDRLIVIATYRGDELSGENGFQRIFPKFKGHANFREIKLVPLLARHIIPFLRSSLGPVQIDANDVINLYKVSKGNPFHLMGILKALAEQKNIIWQDEAWILRIGKDILSRPPKAIEELLIKNMDKVGAHHAKILEWVAISSSSLSIDFINALTGLNENQINYVVNDLVKERYFIQEEEQQEYSISSSNIEEEILKTIPEKQQKKMHLQFAKIMEKKALEEKNYTTLSDHYELGDDSRKTLQYSMLAAEWLLKEKRMSRALKYYRRALEIAEKQKKKMLFEIHTEIGFILFRLGSHKDALNHFKEASTLTKNKPEELAKVQKGKGLCFYGMRRHSEAMKELKNAVRHNQDAEMVLYMNSLEIYKFQLKKAIQSLQIAQENVKPEDMLLIPLLKKQQGWLNFYIGNWKEAKLSIEKAEEIFTDLQSNQDIIETLLVKAYLCAYMEGFEKAQKILEQAYGLLEDIDDWYLKFQANFQSGIFYIETRNVKKAEEHFNQIKEITSKRVAEREQGYHTLGMGLCALIKKEPAAQVEKFAEKTLEVANNCNDKYLAAEAYLLLAKIYRYTKRYQMAQQYLKYSSDGFLGLGCKWKANRLFVISAKILAAAKQGQKALNMLIESEKYAKKINDLVQLAENYFVRGIIFGSSRQYKDSMNWFLKSQELYNQLGMIISAKEAETNARKCLAVTQRHEKLKPE